MYNDITDFREFIMNANDEQIIKVIEFINLAGFYDGMYGASCNDEDLATFAMYYANSNYTNVKNYFRDNIDVIWRIDR